ncbi:hypothetical protein KY342_04150 [Candidatus Woesearchaeota archaeon]|nr:hypothetical protein [Candidatus Woesearchaeota archaeon]
MRKAVSTSIVVILVLLILVSLILMSYQWLLTSSPQTQWEIQQSLGKKEGCLKIENIDTVNKEITIRNCGNIDLSDIVVYLDYESFVYYSGKLNSGELKQISYIDDIPSGDHEIFATSDNAESSKLIINIP